MVIEIGDVFSVPLMHFDRDARTLRPLGVRGLGKILALDGAAWFVAALDNFAERVDCHRLGVGIMSLQSIPDAPARSGHILVRGESIPEDWEKVGNTLLTEEELVLAALYQQRKARTSRFDSQTASKELKSVFEGLDALESSMAIEWRFRFDLDAVVEELTAAKRRHAVRKPKPTWHQVSIYQVATGPRGFRDHLRLAHADLIRILSDKRTKKNARSALTSFFRTVNQHDLSAEYRDEVANIGADIGEACDLTRQAVYKIAEKSSD